MDWHSLKSIHRKLGEIRHLLADSETSLFQDELFLQNGQQLIHTEELINFIEMTKQ